MNNLFEIEINKETNGCRITGITPRVRVGSKFVVPESIDGHIVEGIASNAFQRRSFSNVNIMARIEDIPEGAFRSCKKLTYVSLPDSIKTIGKKAFYNCENLTEIQLCGEAHLYFIGVSAFERCSHLKELKNLVACDYIFDYAFANTDCFKSVNFKFTKTYQKAFIYSGIKELTISENVKYLGKGSFEYCHKLQTVVIERESVLNRVPDYCFFDCSALKEVLIKGVNSIVNHVGDYAFALCLNLSVFELLPKKEIGDGSFYRCSYLKALNVDQKVKTIGTDIPCDVNFV